MSKVPQSKVLEAAWKYNPRKSLDCEFLRAGFIAGARWMEEELSSSSNNDSEYGKYIEQFNKSKSASLSSANLTQHEREDMEKLQPITKEEWIKIYKS